mmetsp:Transcript_35651/g.72946  ORF Transcript_35651/g.72946 Transcript_35651/m.72946 type:complete len:147 (-) Transcript_35651:30-470(-)|eukprot:CAMPEP_0183307726 /NCGR_PEP_ID=MMETSP0160_2-20130417/18975_1 /TAXON_ID=2839 ORGANISM="Odontella Sinensis, Strain Grunow 1884" /NCGR_SAMPLE_ID=MMETSP0160_2 /ASSEMBLY_ACC=CAM_ASM_000250 /LENGTH=146 /DNA_ID=CAMNT_0025471379 /DNA_START=148 /DNA_END=588 /DNA_ORIENTATION=+
MKTAVAFLFALIAGTASAFAPPSAFVSGNGVHHVTPSETSFGKIQGSEYIAQQQPAALQRQRRSMAPVQTMSLFGLGGPELAVILIAAAFLLGPQKLAELGKDAGKIAGELKEVPKEFQKGMAEGEVQAKEMKKEILGEPKDAEKE